MLSRRGLPAGAGEKRSLALGVNRGKTCKIALDAKLLRRFDQVREIVSLPPPAGVGRPNSYGGRRIRRSHTDGEDKAKASREMGQPPLSPLITTFRPVKYYQD